MRTLFSVLAFSLVLAASVASAQTRALCDQGQISQNGRTLCECAFNPDCRLLTLRPDGSVGYFASSKVKPNERLGFWQWLVDFDSQIQLLRIYTPEDEEWDVLWAKYETQPKPGEVNT